MWHRFASGFGAASLIAALPAHAVTSTWLDFTANWSDASRWSSNPLYPCNGNGGQSFDVVIPMGSPTLDLACSIEALALSGGGIGGSANLTVNQPISWSDVGSLGSAGTITAASGVSITGPAMRSLAGTRSLWLAGPSQWSDGLLSLGAGGATLRNQSTLTVTGPTSRALIDTADSGTFVNEGAFTLALDDPASNFTLSPGTLTHSGALHVDSGTLILQSNASYLGSVDGAGTFRIGLGNHTFASGSSLSVNRLEQNGGTLTVQALASFAPNDVSLSTGTLTVNAAATIGTLRLDAVGVEPLITGSGTLVSSGLVTWIAGRMAGSGTTRAASGAVLSGTSDKNLTGARTFALAGGESTWSAGRIELGSGGATLQNEAGSTLTVTGTSRLLRDDADDASVLNEGTWIVQLANPGEAISVSASQFLNGGTLELVSGRLDFVGPNTLFTQTAGVTRLAGGTLAASDPLFFLGGALEGSGVVLADVMSAGVIAPGASAGMLTVSGDLSLFSGSALRAELAGIAQGAHYDFLLVDGGDATLAGTLAVAFLTGFETSVVPANVFTILEADALGGSFANVESGERVLTPPAYDSIVVSYGPGSPFGANRVVLHDFRAFVATESVAVQGTAQGGTITLSVAGVAIVVNTSAGQSAEQVAEAIAAAIRASQALSALGIAGVAHGHVVDMNGALGASIDVTDAGLSVNEVVAVPSLPAFAWVALFAALTALGARAPARARGRTGL
jgi:hypothetical protein